MDLGTATMDGAVAIGRGAAANRGEGEEGMENVGIGQRRSGVDARNPAEDMIAITVTLWVVIRRLYSIECLVTKTTEMQLVTLLLTQ